MTATTKSETRTRSRHPGETGRNKIEWPRRAFFLRLPIVLLRYFDTATQRRTTGIGIYPSLPDRISPPRRGGEDEV